VRGARIEAAEVVASAEVGADEVAGVINGDVVFAWFVAHGYQWPSRSCRCAASSLPMYSV
jgi:hypothetical protein